MGATEISGYEKLTQDIRAGFPKPSNTEREEYEVTVQIVGVETRRYTGVIKQLELSDNGWFATFENGEQCPVEIGTNSGVKVSWKKV